MGAKRTRKIKKLEVIDTDSGFTSADVSEAEENVKINKPEYKHNNFKEKQNNYKNKVRKIENIEINLDIEVKTDAYTEDRKVEQPNNIDNSYAIKYYSIMGASFLCFIISIANTYAKLFVFSFILGGVGVLYLIFNWNMVTKRRKK